jgi:DNA-binding transcriptional MerR regulator
MEGEFMAKSIYYIHEVAEIVGKHPNTIRNYLRRGLITEPQREWNGWRIFTDEHISQIKKLTRVN